MRLIDADALRKDSKMLYSIRAFEPVEGYTQDQIDYAPTVDAAPVVHGKWIEEITFQDENWTKYSYECSECTIISAVKTEYCPNCAAKMNL